MRMCVACGKRKAVYWSVANRRMRSNADHSLCKQCRLAEQDRYRVKRMGEAHEGEDETDE